MPFDRNAENQEHVLLIGSNNVFEVNCRIEAAKIGNNNVFGSKSFIGNSTQIPNGCHIGAGCQVLDGRILANNTVMFGENCCTRVAMNPPQVRLVIFNLCMVLNNTLSIFSLLYYKWTFLESYYPIITTSKRDTKNKTYLYK